MYKDYQAEIVLTGRQFEDAASGMRHDGHSPPFSYPRLREFFQLEHF